MCLCKANTLPIDGVENVVFAGSTRQYASSSSQSFNNKIYIRNVSVGAYKLINTLNNSELNFVLEENGTITGNAKISNVTESE